MVGKVSGIGPTNVYPTGNKNPLPGASNIYPRGGSANQDKKIADLKIIQRYQQIELKNREIDLMLMEGTITPREASNKRALAKLTGLKIESPLNTETSKQKNDLKQLEKTQEMIELQTAKLAAKEALLAGVFTQERYDKEIANIEKLHKQDLGRIMLELATHVGDKTDKRILTMRQRQRDTESKLARLQMDIAVQKGEMTVEEADEKFQRMSGWQKFAETLEYVNTEINKGKTPGNPPVKRPTDYLA